MKKDIPVFEDYKNLAWKASHRQSTLVGGEVEEWFSIASYCFVKTLEAWARKTDNNIKFSTFYFNMIKFEFINEGKLLHRRTRVASESPLDYSYYMKQTNPGHGLEETYQFKDTVSNLSKEAQEVIRIIFQAPEELKRISKSSIYSFLRNQGWSNYDAELVFSEIKEALG